MDRFAPCTQPQPRQGPSELPCSRRQAFCFDKPNLFLRCPQRRAGLSTRRTDQGSNRDDSNRQRPQGGGIGASEPRCISARIVLIAYEPPKLKALLTLSPL